MVSSPSKSTKQSPLALALCAIGVYVCYIAYGQIQEKLQKEHKFFHTTFVLFFCSLSNVIISFICKIIASIFSVFSSSASSSDQQNKEERVSSTSSSSSPPPNLDVVQKLRTPSAIAYMKIAICYIGAMYCSSLALRFISYPMQVLAKSCKMVPIMIANLLINKKKFTWHQYLSVALITGGITAYMFLETSSSSSSHKKHSSSSGPSPISIPFFPFANIDGQIVGLLLALCSLGLDGLTASFEEQILHSPKYKTPTTLDLMLNINAYASVLIGPCALSSFALCSWFFTACPLMSFSFFSLSLVLFSGSEMQSVDFAISQNPALLRDLLLLAIAGAAGNICIFATVARFGALFCSALTTTRKMLTILLSVFVFGHQLVVTQWVAISAVFAGLGLDLYRKWTHKDTVSKPVAAAVKPAAEKKLHKPTLRDEYDTSVSDNHKKNE